MIERANKQYAAFMMSLREACEQEAAEGNPLRAEQYAAYGDMPQDLMDKLVNGIVDKMSNYSDVRAFQTKFGQLVGDHPRHLTRRKLNERIAQMQEELDEFTVAVDNDDIAEQADALVDLVYFALGTAAHMGLPWQALWDDVQRANMSKVPGVKPERGFLVDCIKPEGWEGPKTMDILLNHGYIPPSSEDDYVDDEIHKEKKDA